MDGLNENLYLINSPPNVLTIPNILRALLSFCVCPISPIHWPVRPRLGRIHIHSAQRTSLGNIITDPFRENAKFTGQRMYVNSNWTDLLNHYIFVEIYMAAILCPEEKAHIDFSLSNE